MSWWFVGSYLCIAPVLRHGCVRLGWRRRAGYPRYGHGAAAWCTGHDGGRRGRGSWCGRVHRSRRARCHWHSGCLLRRALTHHWQPETEKNIFVLYYVTFIPPNRLKEHHILYYATIYCFKKGINAMIDNLIIWWG